MSEMASSREIHSHPRTKPVPNGLVIRRFPANLFTIQSMRGAYHRLSMIGQGDLDMTSGGFISSRETVQTG